MSMRLPGLKAGPESGTYANHPASGAELTSMLIQSSAQPMKKVQYPKLLSLGNGTLRAPTIVGTKYSPIAVMTGTANRNIIVVPCTENSWLYLSGPTIVASG